MPDSYYVNRDSHSAHRDTQDAIEYERAYFCSDGCFSFISFVSPTARRGGLIAANALRKRNAAQYSLRNGRGADGEHVSFVQYSVVSATLGIVVALVVLSLFPIRRHCRHCCPQSRCQSRIFVLFSNRKLVLQLFHPTFEFLSLDVDLEHNNKTTILDPVFWILE